MTEVLKMFEIPHSDAIRGNITLPDRIGDFDIIWTSSNPSVISDKKTGNMEKGAVTRSAEDVKVVLKAEARFNDRYEEKEFEVLVLKKPAPIMDEDYQGYLFGHFIGEADENGEQIYFALSENGLKFSDMNGSRPVIVSRVGEKGLRDPFICRSYEGDRFFLVATDLSIYNRGGWFKNEQGYYDASTTGSPNLVFSESSDLINWSEPRLIEVAPENAGMAWAPEIVYYEETGEYIIFFSSSIMDPVTKLKSKPNAIYYVSTRDFVNFSETRLFIDNQTDNEKDGNRREIIDTTVLKIGDYYYSASKDGDNSEANGGIRIMRNRNLLDTDGWEKVLDLDELGLATSGLDISALDNTSLEGPELFRYNKCDWRDPEVPEYGLMADRYNVNGGYLPLTTTDIEDRDNSHNSWRILEKTDYSFDKLKKRHGTVMALTKKEIDFLKSKLMN